MLALQTEPGAQSALLAQCLLQMKTWRDAASPEELRKIAQIALSDPGAIVLPPSLRLFLPVLCSAAINNGYAGGTTPHLSSLIYVRWQ